MRRFARERSKPFGCPVRAYAGSPLAKDLESFTVLVSASPEIARDLADASLAGLSADRRFATAYDAATPGGEYGHSLRGVSGREQGRTPPGILGEHETGVG